MSIDISTLPASHEDAVPALVRFPGGDAPRWVSQEGWSSSSYRSTSPYGWGGVTITALLVEDEWVEVTLNEWQKATHGQRRVTRFAGQDAAAFYVHRDEYVKPDPYKTLRDHIAKVRRRVGYSDDQFVAEVIAAVREHDANTTKED